MLPLGELVASIQSGKQSWRQTHFELLLHHVQVFRYEFEGPGSVQRVLLYLAEVLRGLQTRGVGVIFQEERARHEKYRRRFEYYPKPLVDAEEVRGCVEVTHIMSTLQCCR